MRTSSWVAPLLLLVLIGLVLAAMLTRPWASSGDPQAASHFAVTGSIKEIMQGIVDPAADVIWDSVAYNVTAAGVEENVPKTTEEWLEVRRHALLLAEATNLLRIRGRRVAPAQPIPGLENEPVGPEDLTPAQIQDMIDTDPAEFSRHVQALSEAAVLAMKAADARSVDGLFAAGDAIDEACETCHLKYWYPKGKAPAAPLSPRRQ